jgi:putative glutamine amidotransferase
MAKPIIGISANILVSDTGMERNYVNNDYVNAVAAAGGVPVIMPIILEDEAIEAQVRGIDGLLLSGGYDVNPLIYGQEPIEKQEYTRPDIDEHDIKLIMAAYKMGKPIFGICRGVQVLNVAFGGTLYQDLSQKDGCYIKHVQNSKRDFAGHTVKVIRDTRLHEMFGDKVLTNSFHHQSVKESAPGFEISALSIDGIVEAIEMTGDKLVMGVQWHPECMYVSHPHMLKLFEKLVDEALK